MGGFIMALRDRKDLFWIFALLILIVAPFVCLFTPVITSITFFSGPRTIAFIPLVTGIWMLFFAFVFVIALLCASYFSKSIPLNIITGIVAIIGFIIIFKLGVQNYIHLHEDKIVYNPIFGKKVEYDWGDLTKVTHELYDSQTKQDERYIFTFTDDYILEFPGSGPVNAAVKSIIYNKALTYEVPFEEY